MIFKRGSTGVYYYECRFGDERVRRSTKQRNPRVAGQMEAAHKTQLAKGEVGIKQPKKTPTLRVFAEESFLPHVRSNFRAKRKMSTSLRHLHSEFKLPPALQQAD